MHTEFVIAGLTPTTSIAASIARMWKKLAFRKFAAAVNMLHADRLARNRENGDGLSSVPDNLMLV